MVYALLSSKEIQQYACVLQAVIQAADRIGIRNCEPQLLMSDFELLIIKACQQIFLDVPISLCFLQLMQYLYTKLQESELQKAYNNPENRAVKECTAILAALA